MTKRAVHDGETRERLIAAARDLFVDRGYDHVTVRDICRAAKANVAAVNYHFGDKLGLYREVAQEAVTSIRGVHEDIVNTRSGASAEERLRHYVQVFLPKITRPDEHKTWIGRLMTHELVAPTPIAAWIFNEAIIPRVKYLQGIVAELLDLDPADPRVVHCVTSIQAQCLFYRPDRFKSAVAPGWAPETDEQVAELADHIVRFSLAGIKASKKASARRR